MSAEKTTRKPGAAIQPPQTWRERAGLSILDPNDPHGNPLATSADRRWLWRIENTLAVSATNDVTRQLAADLYGYLVETCEHHYLHYEGGGDCGPHDQCLWCCEVVIEHADAREAARALLRQALAEDMP